MNTELIKLAASQGIWAIMSIFLLFYILKNQEKRDINQDNREKNYQQIIENLSEKLNIVNELRDDMETIKKHIISKYEN